MNDAGRIGFVLKGEYEDTATYDFLDVVYYNSASYVAKKLTVGNVPQENNEFWQVLTKCTGSEVTGIKGKDETEYRTGNVEITPDNIGALSLTGGTMTGKLAISEELSVMHGSSDISKIILGNECWIRDGRYLIINKSKEFTTWPTRQGASVSIYPFDDRKSYVEIEAYQNDDDFADSTGYRFDYDCFRPRYSGPDLGASSNKWINIYATNGTIQTSDRNEKNTIEELTAEKAQQLIYGLKPSTYKMNAGTSGRTHWGMISQDIEELFEEIGMTSLDFAGFIKSPKMTEPEYDDKGECIKESEAIEGEYDYSLRYDEFIAPIIKVIQTQHEEIELLNEKNKTLEQRIDLLEQQALQR